MMLAENEWKLAAFAAVLGLLMFVFPALFIVIADIQAAIRGYEPVKGHPMRSRVLHRLMGVAMLLFALVLWRYDGSAPPTAVSQPQWPVTPMPSTTPASSPSIRAETHAE